MSLVTSDSQEGVRPGCEIYDLVTRAFHQFAFTPLKLVRLAERFTARVASQAANMPPHHSDDHYTAK